MLPGTKKIWMNGALIDWADARVHVGAHGLHDGTAVFEGIRYYNTQRGRAVFRLNDHLHRLKASARPPSIEIPYSIEDSRATYLTLVEENSLPEVCDRLSSTEQEELRSAGLSTRHALVAARPGGIIIK